MHSFLSREAAERDLQSIKDQMSAVHDDLQKLRRAERPPMPWLVWIFFIALFIYLMYKMYTNENENLFSGDDGGEDDGAGRIDCQMEDLKSHFDTYTHALSRLCLLSATFHDQ
jgi:hypothetical protein